MSDISYFDVIIMGAGPAGSTAALALQKSGLTVALFEKETFPRDKICGDALACVVERVLRQIDPGLEQELLAFSHKTVVEKAAVYSPEFRFVELEFSKRGHCIKRIDFDNWLFEKARQHPNITVFQNVKVTNVFTTDTFAEVMLQDERIFRSAVVIGCDGAHSIAAKQLIHFKMDRKHYCGAVRQYYKNVSCVSNTLEIFFLKDYLPGYFWIFPLKNNEANVGFGLLSETISNNNIDLKKSLQDIVHTIPELAVRFKDAEPLESVKGFGLPLGSKKYRISGKRFMLCGDAASLIDPLTGEGIETAMESGKYAAEQVIKCVAANDFSDDFMRAYDDRIHKKMWKQFHQHYLLQRLISNRTWLINRIIRFANIPWVKKLIIKKF